MLVKHEIKSQLAKLLATEDLVVEHREVQTAEFDVHTRVLTLPNWEYASNNVYDSLVAHEVGHALYTPDQWDWIDKIPQTFVNVVEDARIEKLMKRRYAGLAKTFYNGYNELNDRDFFEIDGQDISNLNLADRANLYFKIGSFINVSFSIPEKEIINLIANAETFTDTITAAEALYNFCKEEIEKKQQEQESNPESEQESSVASKDSIDLSTDDGDDSESTVSDTSSNGSVEDGTSSSSNVPVNHGTDSVEPEIETADALQESLKDLVNMNDNGTPNSYVELPELDLDNIIVPNKFLHNGITQEFLDQQEVWNKSEYTTRTLNNNLYDYVDQEFVKFKRNAQKEVNYLVKEFECKKSADSYARATTARTGILDTTKLHTYKYNEDLFKKITIIPDGKSHGLVFILDWSGSMCGVMLDTIKQLYNLLWFCKKVNIPFEVYAFTNSYPPVKTEYHKLSYEKKDGLALIEENFSLMNLFTSKVRNKELDIQMKHIFRIACHFNREVSCPFRIPLGMDLSGTPLNETIVALHKILPKFQKENNLQKVQCVILTDGEAAPLKFSKTFHRDWESDGFMGSSYINDKCIIRNRKTGHTYSCAGLGYWADITNLLLKDLRQSFLNMNFIGIRIMASRDAGQFVRRYAGYEGERYEKTMKEWKREKAFSLKDAGYHTYFGLCSSALANDDEFEVREHATKAQIKRAFVKSLKTKKMNKKILGEFIELVA